MPCNIWSYSCEQQKAPGLTKVEEEFSGRLPVADGIDGKTEQKLLKKQNSEEVGIRKVSQGMHTPEILCSGSQETP